MLGKGTARVYNMVSLFFVSLSALWVGYVLLQLASG